MRRIDRLFHIIQRLRKGRVVTAARLAEELEVSERTVYRDIRELMASGVPIEGEAGVGYLLRQGYDVPPLMFTPAEIEALAAGARMVRALAGGGLAASATQALDKIEAVLPPEHRAQLDIAHLFIPTALSEREQQAIDLLRAGIHQRRRVRFAYVDESQSRTDRCVRPLGLYSWGKVWTLAAWCELRHDFRHFRIDRMEATLLTDQPFQDEPGKMLADCLAQHC